MDPEARRTSGETSASTTSLAASLQARRRGTARRRANAVRRVAPAFVSPQAFRAPTLAASGYGGERQSRRVCRLGWVGRTHCWVRPPEEPDLRLSPHPARAGPAGLITQGPTIRSTGNESSAGPLTAAVAAASSLSIGRGVVVIVVFGVHLTTSALFRAGSQGSVSGRLSEAIARRARPSCPGFPLRFRCRRWLFGHPVPAEELGVPRGRLTGQRPDPDGVSVFRTHELRSGWVPSLLRGQRCSS